MKNISTYVMISILSLVLVVATAFLMTAADAPIREAGGYLPLIFGAVFSWSTAKANLMERERELHAQPRRCLKHGKNPFSLLNSKKDTL